MKHLAAVGLLALLAVPAIGQEQPGFQEKLDVNLVLLDAIVTDNKGNQILGLSKDDFVVRENGVPQSVDAVDYFTNRTLLDAREGTAPFKVEKGNEQRYFVIFFDKPQDNQLFDELAQARSAARRFVDERMRSGDQVAVAGHDVRLKVYSDFTSDKRQLRAALEESARFGPGLLTAPAGNNGASILRDVSRSKMMDRTGTVYEALELLGEQLHSVRGRKNVILFSPGIVEMGETVRDGILLNKSRYYDPMIHSLNEANVAVYPVQLQRNLAGNDLPVVHQTLESIASDTSGDYFRYNTSFDPALRKIEQTNNGYYLISYYSPHARGTSGYQKVEVSLRSPGLRVKSREGYSYGE
ncbi:MAG TPA: VWA domain-containing protein [Thermoanaerobaculia bacterium]|jgi:VWFA-related protein|nr:VWA domain-containing protein [Thermoanaerobaculia bacterium]